MKEFERSQLTSGVGNSTLKVEGNIMAEQRGEQPPKPRQEPSKSTQPAKTSVGPEQTITPRVGLSAENVTEWAKSIAGEQGLDWDTLPLPVRKAFEDHVRERGPSLGAMTPPPGGEPEGEGEERLTPETAAERLARAARDREIGEELGRRIVEGRLLTPEMETMVARLVERRMAEIGTAPEESPYGELRRQVRDYKARERAFREMIGPHSPEEIEALRVEGATLSDRVNRMIDQSPVIESQLFPAPLLEIASAFKETRERLINRILFRAFEDPTETRDYSASMNLYAQSHLEVLLGFLEREDPERYIYYQGLETAAQLFHVMNARLIGGNLDQFIGIAANLNYQHFTFMQGVKGVSEAMRKFEEKYQEFIARHDRITPEGYNQLKREVKEELERSNGIGLLKSEFMRDRVGEASERLKMKNWEIERAVNIARTFYNITFRSAEIISQGQVPEPLKEYIHLKRRYSSFPQESAVKIMNWIQWTTERFGIASPRGGLEFLNRVKNNYFEFLRDKKRKLGINRIVKFGGMRTDDVEVGAMFGVSGVYSSWRMEDLASSSFSLTVGGETMSVEEWLTRNEDAVASAFKKAREKPNRTNEAGITNLDAYYNAVSPLIENLDIGLGWLIKHGMFGGEAGYRVRKRLWERVAENNLPLMVNYLSKLQFGEIVETKEKKDGKTETKREIRADGDIDSSPLAFRNRSAGWTEEAINNFKRKIALDHEKRIAQAAGEDVAGVTIEFTLEERALIERIKDAGKQLAPQFADIVFPYVPFLNDIPFNFLDYRISGNEFYKRRNGDLVNYNKAEGAFTGIMNNPGGTEPGEILKHFDEIVKGIESPQGTPDALERVFPMFKSWFDIIETLPGQRQIVIKNIRQSLKKPTSVAQEYAGMKAPSLDEAQIAEKVDEALQMGVVDWELAREMKKKKNAGFFGILWMLFRDYWWMPFVVGGKELVTVTYKGKAA